jgi:hypothetical protein
VRRDQLDSLIRPKGGFPASTSRRSKARGFYYAGGGGGGEYGLNAPPGTAEATGLS